MVLELRRHQLEKKITFEDGWPVGCRSNLLHETLGRFLVDRGRLTEAQCHEALAHSAREAEPLGEVLVKKGWLTAYDLYRSLQQRMARHRCWPDWIKKLFCRVIAKGRSFPPITRPTVISVTARIGWHR